LPNLTGCSTRGSQHGRDYRSQTGLPCRFGRHLSALDFAIKPCGTYTGEDIEPVLSRIAFDQEFANTGAKTVQLDRSEPVDVTSTARNPLAKSLLYHLRHLDADAIDVQFDGVRDRLFHVLRSLRLLPPRVDVAIDLHEWRFYGSADTDHVLITYPDLGTNRAYYFATICIVAPGVRFTLAVFPMDANRFRAKQEAVRSLITTARRYISIRHVYLDRGFYQVHVVAELERLDVSYIVRARPSKGMKARLSAGAGRSWIPTRCSESGHRLRRSTSPSSPCRIERAKTNTSSSSQTST